MNAHAQSFQIDNIQAEQAVIATVLMNNAAFDAVSRILEPEHFAEALHQSVFRVISTLITAGKAANPVTLMSYLPDALLDDETSLRGYLAELVTRHVVPIDWIGGSAAAVYEMWLRRLALTECGEFMKRTEDLAPDEDILDMLGTLEERLAEIRAKRLIAETKGGVGSRYLEAMTAAAKRGRVDGVPICLPEIGRVLSEPSFEVGNLYGLLSSSGEGKTSLTLQIITHALGQGHPVLFLSFDQSEVQCVRQMVAQRCGITARRQRDADLSSKEWEMVNEFGQWIERQPFEVAKCTNQNAAQLKGFARTFVRRHGNGKVPLIVVDHIKAVTPEDRRADPGTQASQKNRVFKSAAEETGTAWLVLNQRNTAGMHRDNPRPIAQDLFGGEGAKQDYDAILYLYRFKKFYDERKDIASGSGWDKIRKNFPEAVQTGEEDIAELGTIKSRFGNPSLKERVEFQAQFTRYRSLKPETDQPELLP